MKLQLLGTGAAEGIPALYADSPVSQYARKHRGKEIRSRAAAVIDDVLKVDFGPDTYAQIAREGIDPRDWQAVFFTHSDDDHLCVSELQYSMFPFTEFEFAPFPIYGNSDVLAKVQARYPDWPLELIETRSFEPVEFQKYTVTPLAARHNDEDAHNILFDDGQVKLLYATDTGYWHEPTWQHLAGLKLDAMVIECTSGLVESDYEGHLSVTEVIQVVDRLRAQGTLTKDAPVWTTHHSHLGQATHCQLEEALAPHGIEPGFDGMTVLIRG